MTALATRLRRLEATATRDCPACRDWPTSVEMNIEYVVVDTPEQSQQRMEEVRDAEKDDPRQLGPCPSCGRTERVPVSKINYTVKAKE
jgi:hypothetical protein